MPQSTNTTAAPHLEHGHGFRCAYSQLRLNSSGRLWNTSTVGKLYPSTAMVLAYQLQLVKPQQEQAVSQFLLVPS
jgi:hypothetical protein